MSQPTAQQDRKPGRSFDDHEKPLGEGLLERSGTSGTPKEDFKARENQTDVPVNGVAERAKVVSVLRKFEDLVSEGNPPAHDEASMHRAFCLAAGRVGLTIDEYRNLVKNDPELIALEKQVLDDRRSKF
jgi:hypothetical protein